MAEAVFSGACQSVRVCLGVGSHAEAAVVTDLGLHLYPEVFPADLAGHVDAASLHFSLATTKASYGTI